MGYRMDGMITWPMTSRDLERSNSWSQYAKSASWKRLEIETLFQRTTSRKWHMGYQMVTWLMTSRNPQRCCEAVQLAILATAWLLGIRMLYKDAYWRFRPIFVFLSFLVAFCQRFIYEYMDVDMEWMDVEYHGMCLLSECLMCFW